MNKAPYVGKYILDWEKLQPCDIILSRETFNLDALLDPKRFWSVAKSQAIRLGSHEYSHAMLYFEGSIIHAHPPMVFASNPQRLCCAHKNDYCYLRCARLTAVQKQDIEDYVRGKVGALYSSYEAAKTPLKKSSNAPSTSAMEFCSRLVANAFEYAGIKLVVNSDYCAPGDFLTSMPLQKMGACSRLATKQDLEIVKSKDYPLLSQKRAYDLIKGVCRIAREDGFEIKTLNSIWDYVRAHPERDSQVNQLLIQSQYLDTWKEEAAAHDYRYNPFALLQLISINPKAIENEVLALFDCSGRYGDDLLQLASIKEERETLSRMKDFYRALIVDINTRLRFITIPYLTSYCVGPLARLQTICLHIIAGTYRQSYSTSVSSETRKLEEEWRRCMSTGSVSACAP